MMTLVARSIGDASLLFISAFVVSLGWHLAGWLVGKVLR